MLALIALTFAVIFGSGGVRWMSVLDVVDYGFVTPAGIVGLFGYAFSKPIGSPRFWQRWALIQPLWDLTYAFVFEPMGWASQLPDSEPESRIEWLVGQAIGFALVAPIYLALFRYGHRSHRLWKRRATGA